ncbi:TPA: XRE family transcriptional regulator [Streptococcus suis]|uniref:spr1629 family repressor/antitoxin n=1 Tax=Streptococcus suis TaxID=1307 RepID=UPI001ABEB932|nr:XRE family transcriptional regulator [Streptococcus suis]MBO4109389.1 XRE family transcriptional regulator [Streptococcus suis]HEM3612046.1 XRE family transcriptional regulator [Streptococcus suis]HEM3622145.1 XRE family transcriptional regulator [Streptococcus suis]HEM3626569.1 XRE family transcriptional regulator [Streptococcus suis]HEM3631657.1 XRE family transcriptional regulator [Streptococcus suis]
MFNGSRLEELRLLNGLTRADLARELEVSEQAIWQFETGVTLPKMKNKIAMARFFQVEVDYFDAVDKNGSFSLSRIAFRNADLEAKKTIHIQMVYLEKMNQMIDYLENFVSIPNQIIYQLVDSIEQKLQQHESLEFIADHAREVLAVSVDNANLLYSLEKSGIYISERLINGNADAYSAWSRNGRPFIVLGLGKSAVRRNFDLAHELGHLLLHNQVDFEELSKEELEEKEKEANQFASYFLLPRKHFLMDFVNIVGKRVSNPDQYILLKKRFGVSIQALEYRAYKLGLLTPQQNSYFYRQISKKGYKVVEPLDLEIPLKKPSKIRSILDVILSNNLLTLSDIERKQRVSKNFISQLFSFDVKFFDKYLLQLDTFDNVIPLFSRKE